MNNNLNLIKIINGASKTLNLVNQLIPVYKKVQPIISKTQNYISKINTQTPNNSEELSPTPQPQNNQPTFFQ